MCKFYFKKKGEINPLSLVILFSKFITALVTGVISFFVWWVFLIITETITATVRAFT